MVVVLGVELRAVDESHRALESFVKSARQVERWRGAFHRGDQHAASCSKLFDDRRKRPAFVPRRGVLEAHGIRRCVALAASAQVIESLLPESLHVGQVAHVLGDGPCAIDAALCKLVAHAIKEGPESRYDASQPFEKVSEHPRRMNESELALGPARTRDMGLGTAARGAHRRPAEIQPIRKPEETDLE
jgi:hypothetical protein